MPTADQNDVLKVTITINGRTYSEDLKAQSFINPDLDGLNTALAEHPGRFAWWATLEALCREHHDNLVAQTEVLRAQLFIKYQIELRAAMPTAEGGKAKEPTLDAINSKVVLDKEGLALGHNLREAKAGLDRATAGRRTMEQKKESLIAIASNMRAEMDHRIYTGKSRLEAMQSSRSEDPGTPPARTGKAIPGWAKDPRYKK